MKRKRLYISIVASVGLYLLLRRKAAAPPAVAGDVTSGSQSVTIDTNVLSPTFGLPIN